MADDKDYFKEKMLRVGELRKKRKEAEKKKAADSDKLKENSELNEISAKTLNSYIGKARADIKKMGPHPTALGSKTRKKANKRLRGIDGAKTRVDYNTLYVNHEKAGETKVDARVGGYRFLKKYTAESTELEEKAPSTLKRIKLAFKNSTKDLPGGPVTKAATLAGIEGAAVGAGYATWGLPGAAISGAYGLYNGYKALKGAYDSIKEDVDDNEVLASMLLLHDLRVLYDDIKEDLTDEDFTLFLDEGFEPEEIVDLFATDLEEWEPLFESIEQLDELSKRTLANYLVNKELRHRFDDKDHYRAQEERSKTIDAVNDAKNRGYSHLSQEQRDALHQASWQVGAAKHDAEKKFERKAKNSYIGTVRATNRLQGKFAERKVVDEPEVRSPKKGYLTKPEKSHLTYKDYKAESVDLEESKIDLNDRSRKLYMNPKMAHMPLEGTVSGPGAGGKGGDNAKIKKQMKEGIDEAHSDKQLRQAFHYHNSMGVDYQSASLAMDPDSPGKKNQHKSKALSDFYGKKALKHSKVAGVAQNMMKKRGMREDTEITEISKKTLGSYINKAVSDAALAHGRKIQSKNDAESVDRALGLLSHNAGWNQHSGMRNAAYDAQKALSKAARDAEDKEQKKLGKRIMGIRNATARLTKEDADYKAELESIVRASLEGDASDTKDRFEALLSDRISAVLDLKKEDIANNIFNPEGQTNESTMVTEISKKTLGSYITKASNDRVKRQRDFSEFRAKTAAASHELNNITHSYIPDEVRKSTSKARSDLELHYSKTDNRHDEKQFNRRTGIKRAVARLTKE